MKALANEGPLDTHQLALRIIKAKGLSESDKVLAQSIALRVVQTLCARARRDKVECTTKTKGVCVWGSLPGRGVLLSCRLIAVSGAAPVSASADELINAGRLSLSRLVNVEIDPPIFTQATPMGCAWVRIWGISIEEIRTASQLSGYGFKMSAGHVVGLTVGESEAIRASPRGNGLSVDRQLARH